MIRNTTRIVLAVVATWVVSGCSTYAYKTPEIRQAMVDGDYETALGFVESIDKGNSELLYLYEKGLLLHYQDEYVKSNETFELAEVVFDELYTKSVTRELAALVITDNIAKYRGEVYETVILNYYKILNYIYLNDLDGALVECRRVNEKLQRIADADETEVVNDPFIQYITALVYQVAGKARRRRCIV